MKKFTLPVLAAALALAACGDSTTEADDTMAADAGTDTTTVIETPAPAETVVIDDGDMTDDDGNSVTIDGADVDATIDEDGVNAEIDVE